MAAHAYARGTDIHLGPSAERHVPHEAWHVVQQGGATPTAEEADGAAGGSGNSDAADAARAKLYDGQY